MATRIVPNSNEDGAPKLTLEFNNGDLRALTDVVTKWKFIDEANALRFAIAVLTEASPEGLCMKDPATGTIPIRPDDKLLAK